VIKLQMGGKLLFLLIVAAIIIEINEITAINKHHHRHHHLLQCKQPISLNPFPLLLSSKFVLLQLPLILSNCPFQRFYLSGLQQRGS
jgi:hypothetical protein